MFKKVCIIGCGLIGSSLARAIKKKGLAGEIVSSNRSNSINKRVIELKIVDDSSSDTKKMADGADLIIIATPLSSYESVILKIKDTLKRINQKGLVVSISSDLLCPPTEQQFMARHLPNAQYGLIDSLYGHDGFLLEYEKIGNVIREAFPELYLK